MLKIAITGNIGTGKSTVCKVFESLGIEVYYADPEARKFYRDKNVIASVRDIFGNSIFDAEDNLRPSELAMLVFNDPVKLGQLNSIIHPLVLEDFLQWTDQRDDAKYILYESALLFESGFHKHFDKSIVVTAPITLARSRVVSNGMISAQDFEARNATQMPQEEKAKMADIIIKNDEKSPLIPRVMTLHRSFSLQ